MSKVYGFGTKAKVIPGRDAVFNGFSDSLFISPKTLLIVIIKLIIITEDDIKYISILLNIRPYYLRHI